VVKTNHVVILAIISSPKQYASLLTSIKTSLSHIETIIETHSPTAYKTISRQTTGDSKNAPRPPLPPKPSRIQKPVIPPKPSRVTSRPTSPTLNKPESELQGEYMIIVFTGFLYF
jgi:hypothetical protein